MQNHPLFPRYSAEQTFQEEKKEILVTNCFVKDFRIGYMSIFLTPHYFFARDVAKNQNSTSSGSFYALYRRDQFDFNDNECKVDLDFFRKKINQPNFDLPISIIHRNGWGLVLDGFHRLAIAAAYGRPSILAHITSRASKSVKDM